MEPIVGKAKTEDVFLITKQWRGFHGHAETTKCLNQSLSRLKVDKVDLLMHWPGPGYSAMGRSKERIAKEGIECYFKKGHEDIAAVRLETWRAMEDAYLAGKCGAIGAYASLGGQDSAAKHWAELDRPPLLEHRPPPRRARAARRPPVLLRWAVQKGYAVIPKSRDKGRIRANTELGFVLDDAEMAALDAPTSAA
ncbi:oxidoreductase [Aureococcus anophagefferens]|nr:oxidoreductase [Aureococcus anophagefferens]